MQIPFSLVVIAGLLLVPALLVAGGWLIVVYIGSRRRNDSPQVITDTRHDEHS